MAGSSPSKRTTPQRPIALIDLKAQQDRIRGAIERAIRVLDHGDYIMGPEVAELEKGLAAFVGVKHALACSSGTDALLIVLMAEGVEPGDAVICPDFTYTATSEVIALLGATPVFADVSEKTFNLDPAAIRDAIETARGSPHAARDLAVDLFGQPADYEAIEPIAERLRACSSFATPRRALAQKRTAVGSAKSGPRRLPASSPPNRSAATVTVAQS